MNIYKIYKHPRFESFVAVKDGFSWAALFFDFFWMIFKTLWLCAGIYLLAAIALTQLEKFSDEAHSDVLDWLLMLGYLVMFLLPGFKGNSWLCEKFEKQGYEFVDSVKACSKNAAIAQVTENYVEILATTEMSELMIPKSILESARVPFMVNGEYLNTMGLLAGQAKLYVPVTETENAAMLLREAAT